MSDLPIVCTLSPADLSARSGDLLPGLLMRAEERRPLEDGYALRFASGGGILLDIARVLEAERACCRFLRFRITAEPDLGPVWLEVTGPAGTREFLESLAA
jgi:hypothetical protein